MKSIGEKKISEVDSKKKSRIASGIMLGIMILSIAGFAFLSGGGNSQNNQEGNEDLPDGDLGFSDQGFWVINYQGVQLGFRNSPEQVVNVSVDSNLSISDYAGGVVYYSGNDEDASGIARGIGPFVGGLQEACLGKCEANIPEKTCSEKIIVFDNEKAQNSVKQKGNCIFIEGDSKSLDAFLYRILGV